MKAGRVVIVGAGHAGLQVAASLRERKFAGEILLLGAEPHPPYQRPPLSKTYLTKKTEPSEILLRPVSFYAAHGIELRTSAIVDQIDRSDSLVRLRDGARERYDWLVLATGARNRSLSVPGVDCINHLSLRTLDEAAVLRDSLDGVRSVLIIGSGFIGMEIAAALCPLGKRITVVEAASTAMSRSVTREVSAYFVSRLAAQGVTFLFNDGVEEILAERTRAVGARLKSGRRVEADLIVVAIGIVPNEELAREARLATANGIVVDAQLRTADPRIFALGDCARFPLPDGTNVRLESIQNASDQGKTVAENICGAGRAYAAVPWFWSDQGVRLQIAGLTGGADRVVVDGDPAAGSFSVHCYRGEALLGVESVGRPRDHMAARRALAETWSRSASADREQRMVT